MLEQSCESKEGKGFERECWNRAVKAKKENDLKGSAFLCGGQISLSHVGGREGERTKRQHKLPFFSGFPMFSDTLFLILAAALALFSF